MITVFCGFAFAQFAMETASSPDSGPIMMSACAGLASRRVSFSASAGVSSPQPMPTRFSLLPPAVPPVIPAKASSCSSARARVLGQRRDRARGVHLVSERECALAVGHDREPHSPLCAVVARAPEVAIVLPTTRTASGSKSFHLPSFISLLSCLRCQPAW